MPKMSSEAKKSIKTCRLCTKNSEVGVYDLFAKCNKHLLHEIKELTGIRLRDMQRQNIPRNICSKCKSDLSSSYEFRRRVIKSQLYFKSKDYRAAFECIIEESKQEVNAEQLFDTVFIPYCNDKLINELDIKYSSDGTLRYEDNNYKTVESTEDKLNIVQSKQQKSIRKSIMQNMEVSSTSKMLDNIAVSIKKEQNVEIDIKPDFKETNSHQNNASTEIESIEILLNENKIEDAKLKNFSNCPDFSISDDSTNEDNNNPVDSVVFFSEAKLKIKTSGSSEKKNNTEDLKQNHFHCQLCEKSFKSNYLLNFHYSKEHKGEKKCKLCEKTFLTKKSLETHLRWHNGEEAYKCRFCDMRFRRCQIRAKHERKLHSRDSAFLCSLCGKTFTTSYLGKNHMVVHTKERAFHCTVCKASFLRKTHLRTHYRSETHKNNEMKMKQKISTVTTVELKLSSQQQYNFQDNNFSQIVPNALEKNKIVLQLPPD